MTARDELVQAIEDWANPVLDEQDDLNPFDFKEMVNAIPDDVLVRYAIERGALRWVDVGTDEVGGAYVFDRKGFEKTLEAHDQVLWMVES